MENQIIEIANEISNYMGNILTKRVYIAFAGRNGEFYYVDEEYNEYIEFVQNFMRSSFSLLKVNDYAMPLSSLNLVFFKISNNLAIILYARAEAIKPGQLLGFKSKIDEYSSPLEELLQGNFPPVIEAPEVTFDSRPAIETLIPDKQVQTETKIRKVPYLLRKLKMKDKFELTESVVLNLIDGETCIEDICKKSNLVSEDVNGIIKKFRDKGWLRIRIIEPEVIGKERIVLYPKLTEPVSLTLGFEDDERLVLKNCSGEKSIDDISVITSLDKSEIIEILDKYEDKGWIDFSSEGKPDYLPKNLKKLSPMGVQLGLMSPKEYKVRELCTGDVSARSIAKSLDMDYNELLKMLRGMEEKKDIKLKIRKG
ncbi:MAG: hypothetical protein HWN67_10210 [Candidatus Helarchaeota archaeon]|nr:hypothetical protein [Candidatus Helarchaeota archaeon]